MLKTGYVPSKKRIVIQDYTNIQRIIKKSMDKSESLAKYLKGSTNYDEVVNRLVEEYRVLGDDALKQKFCWMLEHYTYYPIEAYPELITSAYDNLVSSVPDIKKFNLLPVMDRWSLSQKKIKSSNFVQYIYQSTFFKTYYEKPMAMTRKYSYTNSEIRREKSGSWIMVDDFIGTGDSFIKSYEYWHRRGIVINGALILVGMESGVSRIKKEIPNLSVFLGKEIKNMCTLEEANAFSKALGIRTNDNWKDYCTGALVTMARTPNNTVPFFYKSGKRRGNKLKAPFMR